MPSIFVSFREKVPLSTLREWIDAHFRTLSGDYHCSQDAAIVRMGRDLKFPEVVKVFNVLLPIVQLDETETGQFPAEVLHQLVGQSPVLPRINWCGCDWIVVGADFLWIDPERTAEVRDLCHVNKRLHLIPACMVDDAA